MADPTKYTRSYGFDDFQSANPSAPLPGAQVDNELENIELSLDEAIDAIKDVRRADGALKNGVVTIDSLDEQVAAGVGEGALAAAQTATEKASEASGYADDASGYASAASGSADDASGYATAAQGYRNEASTFRDLADSARTGAQAARDAAMDWATAAEDAEVDDGVNDPGYSAYHYMKKTEAIADDVAEGVIPDGGVTTAKIDDEAVTEGKLASDVTAKLNFTSARAIDDDKLLIVDPSDDTKRVRVDAGSVTAGQTRVLASPDFSGTLYIPKVGTAIDDDDIDGSDILTLPTDGNVFVFSGSQTVDAIAASVADRVVLRHTSSRTFTHHSTDLICPGGVDLIVIPGDVTEWIQYASGDWICIGGEFSSPRYESAQTDFSNGNNYSFTHGLGRLPNRVEVYAVCTTSQAAIANAGERIRLSAYGALDASSNSYGVNIRETTTAVEITVASGGLLAPRNDGGVANPLTASSFRLVVKAW